MFAFMTSVLFCIGLLAMASILASFKPNEPKAREPKP